MKRSNPIRSTLAAYAFAASAAAMALVTPASAAQREFTLWFKSQTMANATGTLVLDDAVCVTPGTNSIMGGPAGCIVSLSITIDGAVDGNGTFTLANFPDVIFAPNAPSLDYSQELIAQGLSDINVFGAAPAPVGVAPFVFRPDGTDGSDDLTFHMITPNEDPEPTGPEFPFSTDAEQCADAVGKAGSGYFAARHKALHACRSSLMKGTPLFTDKSKTTAVEAAMGCPTERKAAAAIAKARAKARAGIEKQCTDALLATLFTCAATVDGVVDPTGVSGCLIESTDNNVDGVLNAEFGF
jgi:hypothetical protein